MTNEHGGGQEVHAPPVRSLLDLSEKVVIVTGGGSGVGRGIALRFAEAGARIVVHYHSSALICGATAISISSNENTDDSGSIN